MTETEAKSKWCPFGRIAHVNGATANSRAHHDPDLAQDCIGSGCMAWRWSEHGDEHGYCGLAGVPTP